MKVFLKFILQETFDEVQILHSLMQRIDTKNEVTCHIHIYFKMTSAGNFYNYDELLHNKYDEK